MASEYEVTDEMVEDNFDDDDDFIKVALHEEADFTEFPKEQDDTVIFSTIKAQFPEATGIRYKGPTGAWRAIRDVENVLAPPKGGWGDRVYCISVPESLMASATQKRKTDCEDEDDVEPEVKRPRTKLDKYLKDLPITGLPFSITETELREYVETKYGKLELCEIKKDFKTGESRGFGFLRFKNKDEAVAAVNDIHKLKGRNVTIKVKAEKPMKLFVGRLPKDINEGEVKEYFRQFGEVQDVFFPKPFKQFCFLTFNSVEDARHVMKSDHELKGNILNIEEFHAREKPTESTDRSAAPPRTYGGSRNEDSSNRRGHFDGRDKYYSADYSNQGSYGGYQTASYHQNNSSSYPGSGGYHSASYNSNQNSASNYSSHNFYGDSSSYSHDNSSSGYQNEQQQSTTTTTRGRSSKKSDLESLAANPKVKGELKDLLLGILTSK